MKAATAGPVAGAAIAVVGAAVLSANNAPHQVVTSLLVVAGALAVLVLVPALGRRWPGETPPTPADQPPAALPAPRRPSPRPLPAAERSALPR